MGLNVVKAGSGPDGEEMMSLWKNSVDLFPAKKQTLLMLRSHTNEVCVCMCSCVYMCVCVYVSLGGNSVCVCVGLCVCLHALVYMGMCMFMCMSVYMHL